MLRLVGRRLAKAGVVTLITVLVCAIAAAVAALVVLWLLYPTRDRPGRLSDGHFARASY